MSDPIRVRYLDLLDSPAAAWRLEGISRVRTDGISLAVPRLRELLEDGAPYVFLHGERAMVGEVRFAALDALQHLYRLLGAAPDFGPVKVRKATPVELVIAQAEQALADLSPTERSRLLPQVGTYLDAHVQPPEADRPACLSYRVLQALDLLAYRVQEVDPVTLLTPLQQEVARSQTEGTRPRPHLRVWSQGRPDEVLGYVFRNPEGRWQLDFAEHDDARKAARFVGQVRTVEHGGLPKVARDRCGAPLVSDDGSFVLDGVIFDGTAHPVEWLRSLQAFVARRFGATVVE